jgi:Tol biopolymer transport system component
LVKDPEDRYQTAKDLRYELKELKQEVESGEVLEGAVTTVRAGPKKRTFVAVVATAIVTVVAAIAVTYLAVRPDQETSEAPVAIEGTFTRLTSLPGEELFPSLSPDGDNVVYASREAGNWDICLKRVGGERVINLTEDSPADDTQPAFSPDGEQIVFRSERSGGGIFVMGATGESVKRLTDFGYNPVWSPDGEEILCATESVVQPHNRYTISQLWAVNVASGEKRLVTEGDAVQAHWSPHGHRIAYWALPDEGGQRDVWTIPADGGEAVPVTNDTYVDWNPVWSPDGNYLYLSSDRGGSMNLWRVPIEEESGDVLGEPQPVTTGASASRHHLSVSRDGRRISYVELVETANLEKVAFDPSAGTTEGQPFSITRGSRKAYHPDSSHDGEWLTFFSWTEQEDICLIRTDGTDRRQLTDDLNKDRFPRWSPDGSRIAFQSNRSGSYQIWTIHPDGSGLRQITKATGTDLTDPVWSPEGSLMAYNDLDNRTSYICQLGKPSEEQTPEELPPLGEEGEAFAVVSWSADGKWLAGYLITVAGTSGGIAIYNLKSRQYRRLTDFGYEPAWLSDSRRLLFSDDADKIFVLDSESGRVGEVLSLSPDYVGGFSISHDNRWIYFSREKAEADIWMLTLNEEQK